MIEARLKILFGLLFLLLAGLGFRAAQVQLGQHARWQEVAEKRMEVSQLVDTTRGRILDVRGRELALNSACIDACVDYRAILPQPDDRSAREQPRWVREQAAWIREQATTRLSSRLGEAYRQAPAAQKRQMLQDQVAQVKADLAAMWGTLGQLQLTGQTREQVEEARHAIIRRIEMRRRYLWYANYAAAAREHQSREPAPWYKSWLTDEQSQAPELDQFDISVSEQYEPHVILPAISPELANYLGKNLDRFPGLTLRRGQHRVYPYGAAASHVIGYLGRVSREDVQGDPHAGDPLSEYRPNDLVGRSGMEAFGEQTLRGRRGEVVRRRADDTLLQQTDAVGGDDVRLSIDIELQRKIENLFAHPQLPSGMRDEYPMYGAAVVIDVPSGEIRSLVSYPTFDLNEFDRLYPKMVVDDINRPLTNRATQAQFEPGSTVKPIVALGAITEGVLGIAEHLECTGYLVLGGRRYQEGKCHGAMAHGSINVSEAIERSCNVFHEMLADRLGIQRLSEWMSRFGMGRPVNVGLPEPATVLADHTRRTGRLPADFDGPSHLRAVTAWFGGIGQGSVLATPLQMANVAATLARDGQWVRPRLATSLPLPAGDSADRQVLPISPAALAAVREGMVAVVESPMGTGRVLRTPDLRVAGKTGTAQASRFNVPRRDAQGNIVRVNGQVERIFLEPSTDDHPNPQAPWYRATGRGDRDLSHAWFIGYAPAERPQIAFAVLVEYGGAGGPVAGTIARDILEAAIEEGYLPLRTSLP